MGGGAWDASCDYGDECFAASESFACAYGDEPRIPWDDASRGAALRQALRHGPQGKALVFANTLPMAEAAYDEARERRVRMAGGTPPLLLSVANAGDSRAVGGARDEAAPVMTAKQEAEQAEAARDAAEAAAKATEGDEAKRAAAAAAPAPTTGDAGAPGGAPPRVPPRVTGRGARGSRLKPFRSGPSLQVSLLSPLRVPLSVQNVCTVRLLCAL